MQNLISKNEKFFIAGANGMVGSAINKALIEKGYGNQSKGGLILTPSRKDLDLQNQKDVFNWFKKNQPTVVVICAAKVGGIMANNNSPYEFLIENLKIQTNIIEASFLNNVKRLLFLGSSCIYPKLSPQPIKEEYLLTGPLEKTNEAYALAKISGIKLCEKLRYQYRFDVISVMPTNLYGPKDRYDDLNSHVLPALIKRFHEAKEKNKEFVHCWGTGKPLREFLHVDDLAQACIFLLENWSPKYDPSEKEANLNYLNIGSYDEISIRKLAEKISNIVQYKGDIIWDTSKPDGTPRKKLDISRIKALGWEPKIDLDTGLKNTYINFIDENIPYTKQ